ncbi:MAG TPA: acyltransferase [Acidimicrobiales bacterium]|nr:acyltransferase [Acidimicrobiales bacterium]
MPLADNPANPTEIEALRDPTAWAPPLGPQGGFASAQSTPEVKRAREFRPDVAGLRGIAVLLVVLFHAGLSQVSGGFVGVDVFFVISGFVITGVLLREHERTKGTSLLAFYARRARRILPAGTIVIIVTVLISYHWLGFIAGNQVAEDDKAAALFYANFHFISLSTNYFTSRLPPSPLQHYWSLSVEEQFYLVYPTIFLCVALVWRRLPIVRKLAVVLLVIIGASFVLSVVQTAANANAAYFSPFTRAWELALGALVAIGSRPLSKLPPALAAALTWGGMACVLLAAFLYTSATAYPGDAVALPVLGAAAIIAGGAAAPAVGAEALLGRLPLQWLGLISYSLYLWHWPLLVVPEEQATHPLSTGHKLLLALLAVAVSAVSFLLIENPVRKAKGLSRRNVLSLVMGGCLIAASLSVAFIELATHP